MPLDDKKNSIAAMIVGGMKPGGAGAPPAPGEEDTSMSDEEAAASDIISAIDAKDAAGLSDALSSFVKLCQKGYGDEEESSEGESEPAT